MKKQKGSVSSWRMGGPTNSPVSLLGLVSRASRNILDNCGHQIYRQVHIQDVHKESGESLWRVNMIDRGPR